MNFVNCACSYKPKQFIIGGYFSLAGSKSNTSFISPNNILDITINYPNSEDNYSYCGNVSGDGIYTLFDNYNPPIFKLLTSYSLETNNGGIYIFSTCNYAKSNNIRINSNNTSYITCYNPFSKTYTWLNETNINGITIGYPHAACFTEGIFYDLNASSSILYAGEIIYNGNNCIMKINNTTTIAVNIDVAKVISLYLFVFSLIQSTLIDLLMILVHEIVFPLVVFPFSFFPV